MIQPGLARISKLLANAALPWQAIHVAGTNGKGSICNYASSMLKVYNDEQIFRHTKHAELSWARFTSPHLVDRWDGIVLNGDIISKQMFNRLEEEFLDRNEKEAIQASEFEILTAVAFKAFSEAKVDIGIVEVGLGGKEDATNIIGASHNHAHKAETSAPSRATPLVTAISKIGLDHQAFLGNTIADIAKHKAGIMKPWVPVVYDLSNTSAVKAVLHRYAANNGVDPTYFRQFPDLAGMIDWRYLPERERPSNVKHDSTPVVPEHIQQNNSVALRSILVALRQLGRLNQDIPGDRLHEMLLAMSAAPKSLKDLNPGRLETLDLAKYSQFQHKTGQPVKILLDGAHNAQSAEVLGIEVEKLRQSRQQSHGSRGMTWILAASQGRNVSELLKPLLEAGDSVFAVEFGPVDGMPWVKPTPTHEILTAAAEIMGESDGSMVDCGTDISAALKKATQSAPSSTIIIAGSLYLVGDVHRILRQIDHG